MVGGFDDEEAVLEVLVLAEVVVVEALSSAVVSFVDWARTHVGMLQSSRQTVHLNGAPIAVIAGLHSSINQAAGS